MSIHHRHDSADDDAPVPLTFSEEVWIAVIQAAGVAVGVGAGIAAGFIVAGRQTRKAFNNERVLAAEQHSTSGGSIATAS